MVILVLGSTVLLAGIALLVLPGPAILVIPLGLVILATEFAWARRWLQRIRQTIKSIPYRLTGTPLKNRNETRDTKD